MISDEDSNTTDSSPFVQQRLTQEQLQKKLYFLSENLKTIHAGLPMKYQMRIPYELITEMANSLLNDAVFEIVKGLMEIQHVTEKHLVQLRRQVEAELQQEIDEWSKKISDSEELDHIVKADIDSSPRGRALLATSTI